ncbi:hypothetical protein ACEPAG_7412 [Sanghuangporus baumii]
MSASYPSSASTSASISAADAVTSSFAPPGESGSDLWEERSNFAGVVLSSVAYGIHLTIYLFVLHHLVKYPTQRAGASSVRARISWGLVAYITWNFILGTFGIAAESKFNEMTFIDDRNFPGGPNGFVSAEYGNFINIFGTVAYVILNWFADGLVIYRFWLIYNFNYWIALIPCLLLLGSFSMGVILLFQLTQPNANLWTKTTLNFGIPYWSISISLNILVTLLIVGKLYFIRRRTRAVLSTHHSRTYTSIAAMLVESAALYSGTALIFLISYARNSMVQNLVLPVLGQVQAISPLLIMWRVARGQAISRDKLLSTSAEGMTPSKLSWRRSYTISGRGATTTMSSANGSAGVLDSTFSAADSHAHLPLPSNKDSHSHNVYLPPLSKITRFSGGGIGDTDADSEKDMQAVPESPSQWEMTTVRPGSAGKDGKGGKKDEKDGRFRGVQVVVERQVETWEERPTSGGGPKAL